MGREGAGRLDPVATAGTRYKRTGEHGIPEIKCNRIIDDRGEPGGAAAEPSAPQIWSSQTCIMSICRPSPCGGTAIRILTGNCCSASSCACIEACIMALLCSLFVRDVTIHGGAVDMACVWRQGN